LNKVTADSNDIIPKVEKSEVKTTETTENNNSNNAKEVTLKTQNEYTVYIDVNYKEKKANVVEKIAFTNNTKEELSKIYLNTYLNAFSGVQSKRLPYFSQFGNKIFKYGNDVGYINITSIVMDNNDLNFSQNDTYVCINMPKVIKPNTRIELTIAFEAKIPKICHRTGYNDNAMWFGNFIPTVAQYDKDGWNINSYYPAGDPFYSSISNFNVSITVDKGYTVIGSGIASVSEKDDKLSYCFKEDMIRDFAFSVSDKYNKVSKETKDNISIDFYYYSNIDNPQKFLDAAEKSLNYCSNKIGTYPYKSFNIIETELFGEIGMEYPEIVFMDSNYLHKQSSVSSLIHETAHQWFYNIIGNNQIKNAWIDEGMVSLIQECAKGLSNEEIAAIMESAYNDLNSQLNSLEVKIVDTDISKFNSWTNYYYIEYIKSKLMFYNLREKMGEEKFEQFLKSYYNKYAFKTVSREDIVNTASEIFGQPLDQFFSNWLDFEELPKEE